MWSRWVSIPLPSRYQHDALPPELQDLLTPRPPDTFDRSIKLISEEPESNQRPGEIYKQKVTVFYNPPLYQLSYLRV